MAGCLCGSWRTIPPKHRQQAWTTTYEPQSQAIRPAVEGPKDLAPSPVRLKRRDLLSLWLGGPQGPEALPLPPACRAFPPVTWVRPHNRRGHAAGVGSLLLCAVAAPCSCPLPVQSGACKGRRRRRPDEHPPPAPPLAPTVVALICSLYDSAMYCGSTGANSNAGVRGQLVSCGALPLSTLLT